MRLSNLPHTYTCAHSPVQNRTQSARRKTSARHHYATGQAVNHTLPACLLFVCTCRTHAVLAQLEGTKIMRCRTQNVSQCFTGKSCRLLLAGDLRPVASGGTRLHPAPSPAQNAGRA